MQQSCRHIFAIVCLSFSSFIFAGETPPESAIASAHPLATAAGVKILKAGGNAFDAAVAITAALGVVEPHGSGLGGGGFWLLYRESDKHQVMIDGREVAPLNASRDMYLDKNRNIIPKASINGPLAAGIPGVPAAIVHIASRYGKLPLSQSLAPAIRLAREGFKVDEHLHRFAALRLKALQSNQGAAGIFLKNNQPPPVGYLLKQPDLAKTLTLIAEKGIDGFYRGEFARHLVNEVRRSGGIWSLKDFNDYKIIERSPLISKYKAMTITSAPPPSSGGVALATMFNMLSQYDLKAYNKVQRVHLLIEIMRRAYRDRAEYLGDTDFVDVPIAKLMSLDYAKQLVKDVRLDEATSSEALKPTGSVQRSGGTNTTHFSVLDKHGNRVAATMSVNYPFGACFVVPGTGFLLNDEMDDFSSKPGEPNAYGLVGAEANAIAPGKRPLSSMSPTFLENKQGVAILGTPGGSRIISMVFLAALKYAEGATASDMAALPRFHHQYFPDVVMYEDKAFTEEELQELSLLGHMTKRLMSPYRDGQSVYGNMQVIVWDKAASRISAASDKRGIGKAVVF